ncbi:hypothetical protein RB653_003628 [Dictyostelium firmibasis]|uniref:Uncharacterized protein n=1 Tax=Dictyostelium firmibasis TaxID=79012 RepID=A0AAN7YVZ1_9MYCE
MNLNECIDKIKDNKSKNSFFQIYNYIKKEKVFHLSSERLNILYNGALEFKNSYDFETGFIIHLPGYLSENYKDQSLNLRLLNLIESLINSKYCDRQIKKYKFLNTVLKTNIKSIDIGLSNEIIKLIIEMIQKRDKDNIDDDDDNDNDEDKDECGSGIYYLLNSILLLKHLVVDSSLEKDYENLILVILKMKKDYIKQKINKYEYYEEEPFVSFSNYLYIIEIIKKKSENEFEFGKKIIDLHSISMHLERYIQIKYHKEIYNTFEKKYNNTKPIYLKALKILLDHCKFSTLFFKKFIQSVENKTFVKFLCNEAIIRFSNYSISFELFKLLLNEKILVFRPTSFINLDFCFKQLKEDNRIIKAYIFESIEKPLLLENSIEMKHLELLYSQTFERIKSSKISIESQLSKIFKNVSITDTPIRFKFLKSIFDELILILNINQINTFLLPLFSNECNDSIIYKLKIQSFPYITPSLKFILSSSSSSSSLLPPSPPMTKTEITEIKTIVKYIPFYLVKEIIKCLFEDLHTSQWCKLQVSLVSWKLFETCREIMNNSTIRPIEVFDSFYYYCIEGKDCLFSLLLPSCKYLKIKSSEDHFNNSYDQAGKASKVSKSETNHLYHFNYPTMSIDSKRSNLIFRNFLDFSSLEILELNLIKPTPSQLNFIKSSEQTLKCVPITKKLILTITSCTLIEIIKELLLPKSSNIIFNLEIHLIFHFYNNQNNLTEFDSLLEFKNKTIQDYSLMNKIKSIKVTIGTFLLEQFQDLKIPNHLILLVEEFNPNGDQIDNNINPLDEFLISKKFNNPNLNNIQTLEIQFNTSIFDLKKIISIFQCSKLLSTLTITLYCNCNNYDNNNNFNPLLFLNQLFNILSFKQFSNIKHLKIKNITGYSVYEHWIPNVNFHSFEPCQSFNFIDFFRIDEKQLPQNENNKIKEEREESDELHISFEYNHSFSFDNNYDFTDHTSDLGEDFF